MDDITLLSIQRNRILRVKQYGKGTAVLVVVLVLVLVLGFVRILMFGCNGYHHAMNQILVMSIQ